MGFVSKGDTLLSVGCMVIKQRSHHAILRDQINQRRRRRCQERRILQVLQDLQNPALFRRLFVSLPGSTYRHALSIGGVASARFKLQGKQAIAKWSDNSENQTSTELPRF